MPCCRQHSQQRPRALEGIRGRLAKLGWHERDEAIEPGESDAKIVRWPDGHREAAVIGRLVDWLKHSRGDLFCTDRPAGELSRGDDPFDRGLFRKNLVSSRWRHVRIRRWRFRGPLSRIGTGQGFGLALGGLKVRVPLSRQLREVSTPSVLDVYLKANLARPIAVSVERPVQPVQAVGVRRDVPSQIL